MRSRRTKRAMVIAVFSVFGVLASAVPADAYGGCWPRVERDRPIPRVYFVC